MDGMKSFAQALGFLLMTRFVWMQFSGDHALTLYDAVISYVIPALIIVVIQHWGGAYLRGQASRADQQN